MFDYEKNSRKPNALKPDPVPAYTFGANVARPDFDSHPELRDLEGYEGVMEAGDILYVPAGMAHQVHLATALSRVTRAPVRACYSFAVSFSLRGFRLPRKVRNELTSYMITYQFLDFTGLKTMFSPRMDPYYAQGRARWEPHLRGLGLRCWDPREEKGALERLARQGELSIQAFNDTTQHPNMDGIISRGRCSCDKPGSCELYKPECCGWGGACAGGGGEPWGGGR